MDTILLYNQRRESFSTEVIRYFILNNKKYFIFTLNEKDANGYIQLYVSRIELENDHLVMKNITDENEWSNFKTAIQNIVTNNRNNIQNTGDLDYKELSNMVVTEFRIFKLKEQVAQELGMNKNVQVKPIVYDEPKTLEAASAQNSDLTIEQILKQVSEGAKNAREVSKVNLNVNNIETPVSKPVSITKPVMFNDYREEKVNKISETKPEIDYKKKYEDSLASMKKLENENVKLINDLVDAKAKLETIKDLLNI